MQTTRKTVTLILILIITAGTSIFAQKLDEETKIRNTIKLYEKNLNENNVEKVAKLFTKEGILILQGSPTIIGTKAMEEFYTSLFKILDFDLTFNIDEVVQMSDDWTFVRTTTTGTVKVLSNNQSRKGNGHEIFILQRQTDGNWKVARYAGSSAG